MAPRTTLPARYPPIGTWPALMRADMAAAYLDYRDTGELARAVARGGRHHHQSAITELGALESQFGRRPLLMTSRRQPELWI